VRPPLRHAARPGPAGVVGGSSRAAVTPGRRREARAPGVASPRGPQNLL
jgi:hypothetical protein